jgi:hypothetical protein
MRGQGGKVRQQYAMWEDKGRTSRETQSYTNRRMPSSVTVNMLTDFGKIQ